MIGAGPGVDEMRRAIAGLAGQLRWAAELEAPAVPPAGELLVCGMGGSAISGDYLAALAGEAGRRVATHRSYGLPGWARSARPLVLALSYSGETEETLDAVRAATEAGLEIAAVTSGGTLADLAGRHDWPLISVPGGLQPRAALGHILGAAARLAAVAGLLPGVLEDLVEAGEVVESLTGGAGWSLAADLAEGLDGRIALVYGSLATAPVARRWKTQINENAKRPAWWSLLPELDHNEIVGWTAEPLLSSHIGIVTLRDQAEPEQVARRFAVTRDVSEREVSWVGEVWSQGDSLFARLMSLTAVGDMTSLAMAERSGVDPMPVHVIEDLKERLREEA